MWNMRRRLHRSLSVDDDLRLTKLVISRKPKCAEAFQFRRWMLANTNDLLSSKGLQEEFSLCEFAATRAPNNYHAWNHRGWCLDHLNKYSASDILEDEDRFSGTWIENHVSDYSGFHYRLRIVETLCRSGGESDAAIRRINSEVDHMTRLDKFYTGHESIRLYMKVLGLLIGTKKQSD